MNVWLKSTSLADAKIVATSIRLPSRMKTLTASEKEVLKLIGDGLAPKRIAEALDVARATIDTHRRNIMKKLRIDDSHKLQEFAIRKSQLW